MSIRNELPAFIQKYHASNLYYQRKNKGANRLAQCEGTCLVVFGLVNRGERREGHNSLMVSDDTHFNCLIPSEYTLARSFHRIKQRLHLQASETIYILIHLERGTAAILPSNSDTYESLCEKYKWSDGIMYMSVNRESVFG